MNGSPAEEYVRDRALGAVAEKFALGFVGSGRTGHERLEGRLAIPYLRPAGGEHAVATLRFRCIEGHDCKVHGGNKYKSLPGDPPRLFNTQALIGPSPYVAICEGEIDAMSLEAAGIPAVGVPGVGGWRDHFDPAFVGYETVFVIADGDEPGIAFADKLAERLPNAKVILLGDGHDANSFMQAEGPEALRGKLGL
ncbi:toprim domain-containing protein [Streptomyces alfalfae]|uniref:toprim domain-containing protein n=1 Tax=Streptomyces alfalfae TaxID=1642299 RepID=UPI001BA582B0|nr:toprim domain-containing protein [Streptomyces alfalfae]